MFCAIRTILEAVYGIVVLERIGHLTINMGSLLVSDEIHHDLALFAATVISLTQLTQALKTLA